MVTVQAADQRALWGKEESKAAKAGADINNFLCVGARDKTFKEKRKFGFHKLHIFQEFLCLRRSQVQASFARKQHLMVGECLVKVHSGFPQRPQEQGWLSVCSAQTLAATAGRSR